jgi:hypothetical protein
MKPNILTFLSIFLVNIITLTSCDELTGDSGSELIILSGQVLSANINANGNMYFAPQMIMAEGGNPFHTYDWSIDLNSNPPSGVSIGAISGIVTKESTSSTGFTAGTKSFTIKVSDGDQVKSENVSLHITNYSVHPEAILQQLPVSEYKLMSAYTDKPYCASLFIMGGTPPYMWAVDPDYSSAFSAAGLILEPIYGLVKGTLSSGNAGKTISFKVVVRDSKGQTAVYEPLYKIQIY